MSAIKISVIRERVGHIFMAVIVLSQVLVGQPAVLAFTIEGLDEEDRGSLYTPFVELDQCAAEGSGLPAPVTSGALLTSATKANAFSGPDITPTAIVLHWTAGQYDNDPQGVIDTLKSRSRQVQLYVDDEGKVYQLTEKLETRPIQTMSDDSWNDVSIGIEIESLNSDSIDENERDLLNNSTQYQTVLGLVRELMSKYGIQNSAEVSTKEGIFGHYEANPGNSDPGTGYMAKIRNDLSNDTVTQGSVTNTSFGTGGAANLDIGRDFSLGTDEVGRRVALLKHLMVDYGLTPEQAAGPVGNFMWESGGADLPPDINEGGRRGPPAFHNGYGWAQWTGGRQRNFINFAIERGYMSSTNEHATDAANYAFLKKELNQDYPETVEELKKQATARDAVISFEATFERAGEPLIENRIPLGQQVLAEYKQTPIDVGSNIVCAGAGFAAIVGNTAFPLITNKSALQNPGMFSNGTSSRGGHPYIAYDILVGPGTPVAAFLGGKVTRVGSDRCGGTYLSVYNEESDLTISYLHLDSSSHVAKGDQVTTGQSIAIIGSASAGCGVAHLHIDAAAGSSRPGCSRLNCPAANAEKFVDIGPQLYETFQILAE